jgi:hypothetical protein
MMLVIPRIAHLKGKVDWEDPEDTAASPSRRRPQT